MLRQRPDNIIPHMIDPPLATQVLRQLPDDVIPHMSDPLLLAEILSRATDVGGFTAHLALRALFVLLTQHGLEYPRFYARLYSLLTPQLFQVGIVRRSRKPRELAWSLTLGRETLVKSQ